MRELRSLLMKRLPIRRARWTTTEIDGVIERWDALTQEKEYEGLGIDEGEGDEFEFLCLIASLYGRAHIEKTARIVATPTATKLAMRCAYYVHAKLTEKDMREGQDRDYLCFVLAALSNDHVYLDPKLCRLLEGWSHSRYA